MKTFVWIFVVTCFPLSVRAYPPEKSKVEAQKTNQAPDFKHKEYNQLNGSDLEFDASLDDRRSTQNKQGNAESNRQVSPSGTRNVISDANAHKRNPAAVAGAKALASNPKVQEAVVEKGIEVAGKLVDKQLQIIEDAQKKASDFLKKKINLDIMPDKGWENEDMFLPPGYHIDAAVSGEEKSPKEVGQTPYTFPMGIGGVMMNGCWGTGYKANDPCYNAKTTSTICLNMIDGAAFMGVGFDGRGKYSPESRKMSIIQRNCANKATYDGLDVPDTMNVHGIYDTSASLITFESRQEYQRHLQQEAGVSGSFFGFSAGVKEAWGESKASASQKYLAVMDIDIDRYEIFVDEVKPKDLSLSFLREFMDLPTSYFTIGAPLKYEAFIQRWGTHYIKSAKFGGQLEIRKTMDAHDVKTKKEFEVQMEMEYKSLFASVGARSSYKEGEKARKQTKTTSTSVVAQGGSQEIASILSDVYSPSFKGEFKEWLKTIPTYPRAFRFQMGFITDLLNFRANDLFPEENVRWGCEGYAASLLTEEKDGKTSRYYEETTDGKKVKHYCPFESRDALQEAIQARRTSLQRAMEIYMEEGVLSLANLQLGSCHTVSEKEKDEGSEIDFWKPRIIPSWKQIIDDNAKFQVSFDMLFDLQNSFQKELDILRNTSRLVRFYDNKWFTGDKSGRFHLYGAFNNGDSKNTSKRKMSILGLLLTFNEADGSLSLSKSDFKASKRFFPTLSEEMIGRELARLQLETEPDKPVRKSDKGVPAGKVPCMVVFSNALRLDPTDTNGKCLHFTASSEGTLFVVFALLPNNAQTWYYVEISPERVAAYKSREMQTYTTNLNALALGDSHLYQSYFVCITETEKSTLIEYGKSLGTSDSGDIYLNMVDSEDHLNARFYGFGTISKTSTKIMDTHIIPRALTKAQCKGDTVRDLDTNLCIKKCHPACDPVAGCRDSRSSNVKVGCYACRHALDTETNNCILSCPEHKSLTREKECVPTFDLLIKRTSDLNQMKISEVPTLKEMTLCLWLLLERYSGPSDISGMMALVRYDREGIYWADNFEVTLGHSGDNIAFLFEVPASGGYWVIFNELKDKKWHQLCVTRSGATGVVHHYKDGKRALSKTYAKGTFNGGGMLRFGRGGNKATVAMTEFNLWDRILTDREIEKNAESCHEGQGNVKQWHQMYNVVRPKTEFFRKRSSCSAPPRNTK